jgi:hypothetical protein
MALPTLDATFASAADLPRRQMLAQWLVNLQYSGSVADYWTLPEHYLWAKIAVAAGAPRSEADYISLPKNYVWSDLYNVVSGSSGSTIDRGEKEAIGWIAAAVRGDSNDPAKVATYINWPWRYQVASIITSLAVDADAQSFITTSGATDIEAIDQFVKGVKDLGLWDNMVCWPLRSTQNAGTGTTAYSLGGLGTFNGTLVNGPTWGANGLAFVLASSQRIEVTDTGNLLNGAGKNFSVGAVASSSGGRSSATSLLGKGSNTTLGGLSYALRHISDNIGQLQLGDGATQIIQGTLASSWPNDTFAFALGRYDQSTASIRLNAGADQSGAFANGVRSTTDQFSIGAAGTVNHYNGTIAFAMFADTLATADLYTLYKTTLGLNLGLP